MRGLVLAIVTSVLIGVAPIWLWAVWNWRVGNGSSPMLIFTTIESLAFALMMWLVYQTRPRQVKCMWCGAMLEVDENAA